MPQIVSGALGCYRRYPLLFAALALAVVLPYALVVRAAEGSSLLSPRHAGGTTQFTLVLLDLLVVAPLISALHIHALAGIGEGRRPQLLAVGRRGLRVLPVVTAAQIVAGLGVLLGFLLLFVPGLILLIRWAVVAQVAAIEPVDWLGALRRSGELTRRHYGHVFGLILLIGLIEFGLTGASGAAVGRGAGPIEVLLGIIVETLTRSFGALTTALLYFDLLARQPDRG